MYDILRDIMKLPPLPNGRLLEIKTVEGIIGGSIWPAARSLCQHLVEHYLHESNSMNDINDRDALQTTNVLELGSGTGAVGLFAAALGIFHTVHLSEHRPPMLAVTPSVPYNVDGTVDWDLFSDDSSNENDHHYQNEMRRGSDGRSDRLLQLLRENLNKNTALVSPSIKSSPQSQATGSSSWPPFIHELDWTRAEQHIPRLLKESGCSHGFELLLASDVTYINDLHEPFVESVNGLLWTSVNSLICEYDGCKYETFPRPPIRNQQRKLSVLPTIPTCIVAHQQRVLNLWGRDAQLENFQRVLSEKGLRVSQAYQYPDVKVSILEIQRQSMEERPAHGNVLWIP